jgi:hypothetical protein
MKKILLAGVMVLALANTAHTAADIHGPRDTDTYFVCNTPDSEPSPTAYVNVDGERILIHIRDEGENHAFPFVKFYDEHWEYEGDVIFWPAGPEGYADGGLVYDSKTYECVRKPPQMQPENGGHFGEEL